MIRILLFEDNKSYREALADALEDSESVFLTKAFEHANQVVKNIREYEPDVVLMDIEMPGLSGLDALTEINKHYPDTKVLIQTQFEDEHRIFVALCRGAWGYALKTDSFEQLETAIVQVQEGGGYFSASIAGRITRLFLAKEFQESPDYTPLTKRQNEVLSYLVKAYTYQEIADALFLSYETIHTHVRKIYKKLHVNSRSAAIMKAIESKLI